MELFAHHAAVHTASMNLPVFITTWLIVLVAITARRVNK